MDQLVSEGKVTRGFLGVSVQPVTPELSAEFKVPEHSGTLIGGVTPHSPAAQAGLEAGDVIVEFNSKTVLDGRHLRLLASQTLPGTSVTIKVLRDGMEKMLTVKLGEMPKEGLAKAGRAGGPQQTKAIPLEGVSVTDLDANVRQQLDVPGTIEGAIVANVEPGSAAAAAGLQAGDVIVEVNRAPVTSAAEAIKQAERANAGRSLLRVWSRGGSRYVVVDPSKKARS